MAAGLGFKDFQAGAVLTAADVNGYLMQGILVFATTAARDAAITSPQEGQFAYITADDTVYYYTGSAWAVSAMDNTAYTAYTPTFRAGSWTAGNGTFRTRYKTIGKFVHFYGSFEFGSTSAVGTGTFAIILPVNAVTTVNPEVYQIANWRDTSATMDVFGYSRIQSATEMFCYYAESSAIPATVYSDVWTTTSAPPFTFATGDFVSWNMVYERA